MECASMRGRVPFCKLHQNRGHSKLQITTYRTETPTISFFCLQCDTSELKASISKLRPQKQLSKRLYMMGDTHTTCKTLTVAVKAKNHGLVSNSIRLTSSSSALVPAPCCLAASLNDAVIAAKAWNLKNPIGWNTICRGRDGVVLLISI